ncbi:hypothetical protein JCM5353_003688 [Sporobolomyces roseus]
MTNESTSKRPRTTPSSAIPPARSDSGTSVLPVSRVNRIIKADQDVNLCSKEAIFLIAKATERMVATMTAQSHANARLQKRGKMVKYSDLASTANQPQWFYLGEVIPNPISLKVAKQQRQQNDEVQNAPGSTAAAGGPEKAYEGRRVMKGKKKALVISRGAIEEPSKRKTRGKKLNFHTGDAGDEDDEDEDDDGEGDFMDDGGSRATSEAGGGMDVDE